MIYLANTDKEEHSIHTFLNEPKNWKSYLILVIASTEDQMLMGKQITHSKLGSCVNWLLATVDEFKALMKKHIDKKKMFGELFVMELTMTGNKNDSFIPWHNWEMLSITHKPKTDPFDEVFAEIMNKLLDQALYNYNEESRIIKSKLNKLFLDLIASGMFHMQPDPKKAFGD
jgi:hypothetical protein